MIGLIPAAGRAERMGGIPKFLLPIPSGQLNHSLYSHMRDHLRARANFVVVGVREFDLHLFDQALHGISVVVVKSQTMCETVLACKPEFDLVAHKANRVLGRVAGGFSANDPVLFGMPDTYFEDDQAFNRLATSLDNGADVAVGVFRTRPEQRSKLGMVRANGDRVEQVIDKPAETDLTWAWGVLAWKPVFWQFIHAEDPAIGCALTHAIDAGLDVRAVQMEGGYWDCGTPDEYFALIRYLTGEKEKA